MQSTIKHEINIVTMTAQAVIFDLDGVLIDSEWLAFKAWSEVVASHGGILQETAFPEMIGASAEDTGRVVMRHTGLDFDLAASVDWTWERIAEWIHDGNAPMPGGAELVKELTKRGLPLAIASNSMTPFIEDALTGLGLRNYFQFIVGIDQVNQGKPAPDVYLRAASLAGVMPGNCLAIEDSRVGAQAAVSAGMRVIAMPNLRDHSRGFDGVWKTVHSLAQIQKDLDDLLGWS